MVSPSLFLPRAPFSMVEKAFFDLLLARDLRGVPHLQILMFFFLQLNFFFRNAAAMDIDMSRAEFDYLRVCAASCTESNFGK